MRTRATTEAADGGQFDAFLKNNPASVGVMAAVVGMAGQLAAQFDLSSLACRAVALGFAVLLACYQIRIAQRRPLMESVVLVPIVAVILFTSGWGASGLLYEAQYRRPVTEAVSAAPATAAARALELVVPAAVAATEAAAQQGKADRDKDRDQKQDGWKRW